MLCSPVPPELVNGLPLLSYQHAKKNARSGVELGRPAEATTRPEFVCITSRGTIQPFPVVAKSICRQAKHDSLIQTGKADDLIGCISQALGISVSHMSSILAGIMQGGQGGRVER